jgi:hypothetical protein
MCLASKFSISSARGEPAVAPMSLRKVGCRSTASVSASAFRTSSISSASFKGELHNLLRELVDQMNFKLNKIEKLQLATEKKEKSSPDDTVLKILRLNQLQMWRNVWIFL